MARLLDRTAAPLELTWHDGAVHLWAVDREHGEPLGLVHLVRASDALAGRHVTAAGVPGRIVVAVPEPGGNLQVTSLRLGVDVLADLGDIPELCGPEAAAQAGLAPAVRTFGATARWFAALAQLAEAIVRAGRVRPVLGREAAAWRARWAVVPSSDVSDAVSALDAVRPPATGATAADLLGTAVDAIARRRLADEAWRPPAPIGARGTEYRAAQAVFRSLSTASGVVLHRIEDAGSIADLARWCDAELHRAAGLPVLAPQLRLHVPDDEDGTWDLSLEIVDTDQPDRWCTAAEVLDADDRARWLAGGHADLAERLVEVLHRTGQELGRRVEVLGPLFDDSATVVALSIADVDPFLAAAPDALQEAGVGLVGPERIVRARAGVRGSATPRQASGSGRFTASALVSWTPTIDDAPVDEAQLERAAEAGASLIHVGGRWVRLDAGQAKVALERLQRQRQDHAELDIATLLALAAEAAAAPGAPDATTPGSVNVSVNGDGWVDELLAGLPDDRLVEQREPDGFVGQLRHYQRRGLGWMGFLGRLGLGGCLADDMGLGKTATTLAHLATRQGPHLVVCPLSVVHNWYAEAARFTPGLQVVIHHGGGRSLQGLAAGDDAPLVGTDVVVTTYGLLARDVDALAEVQWDTVVLDEAQAVKNHLTNAAKAVRRLPAAQRLALTGTPVENHLGDLWSILDAVNPGLYGSAKRFSERYAKPIQRSGDPEATAALRALTQPFVLRRTKADKTLLPELPDKIEQIAWATLTKEQASMYQAVVDQLLADAQAAVGMRRRGLVLAALTRLKQICNHPAHATGDGSRLAGRSGKLIRFDELVDDLLDGGERALVFTQFREMGLLLQRHVDERLGERFGAQVPFLHGGINRAGRDRMVARFQDGDGPPLLIVSLKAGGTGLNLTAASQVIHYDRWWNPAVEDQATDRAWRLGQQHTVVVHKLVCEGTLEERIGQLIDDKKALAASVLGTGEGWLTELSTDDLRDLVRLDRGGLGTTRGAGR